MRLFAYYFLFSLVNITSIYAQFQKINHPKYPSTEECNITCFVFNDGLIYAGSENYGVFISSNLGSTWEKIGPENFTVSDIIITDDQKIYVSCGQFFYKFVTDTIWKLLPSPYNYMIKNFYLSGDNKIYCKAENSNIFVLHNDSTWELVGNYAYANWYYEFIYDMYNDHYYSAAGIDNITGFFWSSTYKGSQFLFSKKSVLGFNHQGDVFIGNELGMFRSEDRWNTHIPINTGIGTNHSFKLLKIFNNNELCLIGYDLFALSLNRGNNWNLKYINLDAQKIKSIEKISDGFFITLYEQKLYKNSTILDIEDEKINFYFHLNQNYPNPFNPSTSIRYYIPEDDLVNLSVYDILGKEVSRLVNEYQTSGFHALEFNGAHLSSGVYFLKLETTKFLDIKKMMIVK